MRYSKTTIKELNRLYRHVLKKCFILNVFGILWTMPTYAADDVILSDIINQQKIVSDSDVAKINSEINIYSTNETTPSALQANQVEISGKLNVGNGSDATSQTLSSIIVPEVTVWHHDEHVSYWNYERGSIKVLSGGELNLTATGLNSTKITGRSGEGFDWYNPALEVSEGAILNIEASNLPSDAYNGDSDFIDDWNIDYGVSLQTASAVINGALNITATDNLVHWTTGREGITLGTNAIFNINLKTSEVPMDLKIHAGGAFVSGSNSKINLNSNSAISADSESSDIEIGAAKIDLSGQIAAISSDISSIAGYAIEDGGVVIPTIQIGHNENPRSTLNMTFSDMGIIAATDHYYQMMDEEDKEELLSVKSNPEIFLSELRGTLYMIKGVKLSDDVMVSSVAGTQEKYVWAEKQENGEWQETLYDNSADGFWDRVKNYIQSMNNDQLIQMNDNLVTAVRGFETDGIHFENADVTLENGVEVANKLSGDIVADESNITLNGSNEEEGRIFSTIINHSGATGDIAFNDSTITMNDDTSLVRGIYEWDETVADGIDVIQHNLGIASSQGDIGFDTSTLNMNGTSSLVLSDTNGRIVAKDNSIININGDNVFSLKNVIDGEGAGAVFLKESTLNIAKGASLTLNTQLKGYIDEHGKEWAPAIHGDADSVINLEGTLKGSVSTAGLLAFTDKDAFIDGDILSVGTLDITPISGEISDIVSGQIIGVDNLSLTGNKEYTLNKAIFSTSDDDVAYVMSSVIMDNFKQIMKLTSNEKEYYTTDGRTTLTPIDNQMGALSVVDGATLSSDKTFYADSVVLDNGASLNMTNISSIENLTIKNGSQGKFNCALSAHSVLLEGKNSGLELGGTPLDFSLISGTFSVLNGATLKTENGPSFMLGTIVLDHATWNGNNIAEVNLAEISSDNSVLNLNNSKFSHGLETVMNIRNSKVTLSNSDFGLAETNFDHTTLVSTNSVIGNRPITLVNARYLTDEGDIIPAFAVLGSGEAFDSKMLIKNSHITLNGNSALESSSIFNDYQLGAIAITPTYFKENAAKWVGMLSESPMDWIEDPQGYVDGLTTFANNIELDNTTIMLNGTSSIINNSLSLTNAEGESTGNVNLVDSELNVNGNNTIRTTGVVNLANSTLNIAQGSKLTLERNEIEGSDGLATIYGDADSVIDISGRLNGNVNTLGELKFSSDTAFVNGDIQAAELNVADGTTWSLDRSKSFSADKINIERGGTIDIIAKNRDANLSTEVIDVAGTLNVGNTQSVTQKLLSSIAGTVNVLDGGVMNLNATGNQNTRFSHQNGVNGEFSENNLTINKGGQFNVVSSNLPINYNSYSGDDTEIGAFLETGDVLANGQIHLVTNNNIINWQANNFTLGETGKLIVINKDPKKQDVDININVGNFTSDKGSEIQLLSDETADIGLTADTMNLSGNIKMNSASAFAFGSSFNADNALIDLTYSDIGMNRYADNYFDLMDEENQRERILQLKQNIANGNLLYEIYGILSKNSSVRITDNLSVSHNSQTGQYSFNNEDQMMEYNDFEQELQKRLSSLKSTSKLKQLHDNLLDYRRARIADMTIRNSIINAEYASEIYNELSGDMNILSSEINLKKGKKYTSIINHQGRMGDIYFGKDNDSIRSSLVNLHDNTGIIKGLFYWDEKGMRLSPNVKVSEGSIIFDNNSTLNMYGTSYLALSDTNGRIVAKNGSTININGNNTFHLINSIQGKGAGSIFLGDESGDIDNKTTLNIASNSSLSLLTQNNEGYNDGTEQYLPIIYGYENSVINIAGTLKGSVSTDGLLKFSSKKAKINGDILKLGALEFATAGGEISNFISGKLYNLNELNLAGKDRYTLNKGVFAVNDDDIACEIWNSAYPKERNIVKLTEGEYNSLIDPTYMITDFKLKPVDNQFKLISLKEGASFSSNKSLYADSVIVDNANFIMTQPFGFENLSLNNDAKMTLTSNNSYFLFPFPYTSEIHMDHSTLNLTSALIGNNVISAQNNSILMTKNTELTGWNTFSLDNSQWTSNNDDIGINSLQIHDSDWTDNSSLIMLSPNSSENSIIITGQSNVTLNNTSTVRRNYMGSGTGSGGDNYTNSIQIMNEDNNHPQITLNKGTDFNALKFMATGTKITANDASFGAGGIAISETLLSPEMNAAMDLKGLSLLYSTAPWSPIDFSIYDSNLTLNGTSSLKFSTGYVRGDLVSGKGTYTDLTPEYMRKNYTYLLREFNKRYDEDLAENYIDDLYSSANANIDLDNTQITLNGISSIINDSLSTETEKGNVNLTNDSILLVKGKNTIRTTKDVYLKDSTLDIAKGATLTVQSGYNESRNKYMDDTIYLDNAILKLSGTLNGSLKGTVSSLTLSSGFKYTGDINFDNSEISGFGVSGVTNVRAILPILDMYEEMGGTSIQTFTMTDRSALNLSTISDLIGNADEMRVENNSTLTVDANAELNRFIGKLSTIKINKNVEMDVSEIDLKDSSLTINGDISTASGETYINTNSLTMDNSNKPQAMSLTLSNAGIFVENGDVNLKNTNLNILGSARNMDPTALEAEGELRIFNDPNTRATINISNADIAASNIALTNTSLLMSGSIDKYTKEPMNGVATNELSIDNSGNNRAQISLSRLYIDGNTNIRNTKTTTISESTLDDLSIINDDFLSKTAVITMKNSDADSMNLSNLKTVTITNSDMKSANLTDIQSITISNSSVEDTLSLSTSENNKTITVNPDTKKQKTNYYSSANLTNTHIDGNLVVDNINLTLNKGNEIGGDLIITDSHSSMEKGYEEKVNATRVTLKDNLNLDSVKLEQGTLEIAANKKLTAYNGVNINSDHGAELYLNGIIDGNISVQDGGAIKFLNNKAQIIGNANLVTTETRFKKVKGNLSQFITGNIDFGVLAIRDSANLMIDKFAKVNTAASALELTDSTLKLEQDFAVSGNFDMSNSKLYLGTNALNIANNANIYDKSTIYIDVDKYGNYGKLVADTINLEVNTSGKNKGKPKNINLVVTLPRERIDNKKVYNQNYEFLSYNNITGNLNNITIANNRYKFTEEAIGQFSVERTLTGRGVIERYKGIINVPMGIMSAASAFLDSNTSFGSNKQNAVADGLNLLSQIKGGEKTYADALSAINPEDDAIVQTTALNTTMTNLNTATARMTTGAILGTNGGDISLGRGAMWTKALYNHTKLDNNAGYEGFKANSKGIAMGIEGKLTSDIKAGIGYSYAQNEIKAHNRNLDVDSHNVSLYGEYKPNNWFIDGVLGLGWSNYEGKAWSVIGTTKSDFDVYTYSAQGTAGYELGMNEYAKFVPYAGLRYIRIDQRDYNDSDEKHISSDVNNTLTALLGSKLSWNFASENGTVFTPSLRLGLSYDFKTDLNKSTVSLSNGMNYEVEGRRLRKLGITGGIGAQITKGDLDILFGYDLETRKDYNSHTGSIKLKYHF